MHEARQRQAYAAPGKAWSRETGLAAPLAGNLAARAALGGELEGEEAAGLAIAHARAAFRVAPATDGTDEPGGD